jgi:hypothetical protein
MLAPSGLGSSPCSSGVTPIGASIESSTKNKTMRFFSCDFGDGVSCKVETADSAPEDKKSHIRVVEFFGKVKPKHLRPYIAWMNSVNQTLSDEWGVTLMHVYLLDKKHEHIDVWLYAPGKPPKRIKST